jgi:hypothetical protein
MQFFQCSNDPIADRPGRSRVTANVDDVQPMIHDIFDLLCLATGMRLTLRCSAAVPVAAPLLHDGIFATTARLR